MTWLLIVTYLLAGATIGRMAWEFDVFAAGSPDAYDWRLDRRLCVMAGILWPLVPALLLWSYVRIPRR